jgi:hypothetical protein
MKTRITLMLTSFLLLVTFITVSGQSSSFTGEWKLNREKSNIQDNQLILTKIKMQLKSDSLLTTRTYENQNGEEYPFDENIALGGKDCKITIYDMPRSSKATLSGSDGTLQVESTTTFNANGGEENLVAKETWKIENGGKSLLFTFTNTMSAGSVAGTHYFDRVK